nr:hypothetical protein Ade03nite_72640 [Actinoplanes derwentensis]
MRFRDTTPRGSGRPKESHLRAPTERSMTVRVVGAETSSTLVTVIFDHRDYGAGVDTDPLG